MRISDWSSDVCSSDLDIDRLRAHLLPFLELQRPVVDAGRQAEAVLGERRLARVVAAEHAVELADGDVALVDDEERSEARRVGEACVSTGRYRWSPYH